jgi:hypothetical protein
LYAALIALNVFLPNVERKVEPNAPPEKAQPIVVPEQSRYLKGTHVLALLAFIVFEIYYIHFLFRGRCTVRSKHNYTKDEVKHTKICLAFFAITFIIALFQKNSAVAFDETCEVDLCLSNLRLSGLSMIPSCVFLLIAISLTVKPEVMTQQQATNPSCLLRCFNGFVVPVLDRCLVTTALVLGVMFFIQMLKIREEQDGDEWGYTQPKDPCSGWFDDDC